MNTPATPTHTSPSPRLIPALALAAGLSLGATALGSEEPYLADNLSLWLRADKGLATNAVGGVTAWANQGTKGAAADVAPSADNSDGHVTYEASGIGGQPSLLFDGSVYLKTASAVDLGITAANGGAWFVVFRTSCDSAARANMGIFGNDNNNARFGAFFPSGVETYRSFFFSAEIGNRPFSAGTAQVISAMCWREGGTTRAYPMRNYEAGTVANPSVSPSASIFSVGSMIPSAGWIQTFKGEIAEIRIYDRALTDRERSRVQFELCARYGVHWAAHGDIDNNALAWCGESEQFGRVTGLGVAEDLVSSASSGGATFTLGTPSAADGARGYFSNSAGNGLSRIWYVATHSSTRTGSDATFSFDRSDVRIGRDPALHYRQYLSDPWTKLDAAATETEESVSFTLPAGWANGFYAAMGDLDSSLAMWHRADMGLETNAVGGVTSWANFGTSGTVLDMAPPSDNSAPHIAYEADGIGGQPSVSFDGDAYLKSAGSSGMGVTANGGAWFVVYQTSLDAESRVNKAIFGGATGAGYRIGAFFPSGADAVRGYFWNNMLSTAGYPDVAVETDKPQILSAMAWTTNGASKCYVMRGPVTGSASTSGSYTGAASISVGGNMLSWTPNFVGDIAEIRIYNRPLTGRERSEIQFELCARYGVSWTGHGGIDDTALSWCGNGAQFGYWEGDGLPEAVVTTAMAGGATLTLDQAPAASAYTRGYLAHDGGEGLERVWYVAAAASARAIPATFAVDRGVVGGGDFSLCRSDTLDGRQTKAGAYTKVGADGKYSFQLPAGWQGGFYRLRKQQAFTMIIR